MLYAAVRRIAADMRVHRPNRRDVKPDTVLILLKTMTETNCWMGNMAYQHSWSRRDW